LPPPDTTAAAATAAAAQSCDKFFLPAGIDLEQLGNLFDAVIGADRTLTGIDFTADEFLGKRQATRLPASTAIGPRE
jgi:hypothetical protein